MYSRNSRSLYSTPVGRFILDERERGRQFEESLYRYSLKKLGVFRTLESSPCQNVSMSFSNNGRFLAHTTGGETVFVSDPRISQPCMALGTADGERVLSPASREYYNYCLFSTTDSKNVFTSSSKGSSGHNLLKLWDIRNTQQPMSTSCTNFGSVVTLKQVKSRGWLLFGHQEGKVCLWDINTALRTGEIADQVQLDSELFNISKLVEVDIDPTESKLLLVQGNGHCLMLDNLDFSQLSTQYSKVHMSTNMVNGGYHHWVPNQDSRKYVVNQMLNIPPMTYLLDNQSSISSVSTVKFFPLFDGGVCLIAKISVQPPKDHFNNLFAKGSPSAAESGDPWKPSFTGPSLPVGGIEGLPGQSVKMPQASVNLSGPIIPQSRMMGGGRPSDSLVKPTLSGPPISSSKSSGIPVFPRSDGNVPKAISLTGPPLSGSKNSGVSVFPGVKSLKPSSTGPPLPTMKQNPPIFPGPTPSKPGLTAPGFLNASSSVPVFPGAPTPPLKSALTDPRIPASKSSSVPVFPGPGLRTPQMPTTSGPPLFSSKESRRSQFLGSSHPTSECNFGGPLQSTLKHRTTVEDLTQKRFHPYGDGRTTSASSFGSSPFAQVSKAQRHASQVRKDFMLQIVIDSTNKMFSPMGITTTNENNIRTKWYDTDDSYKPLSRKRICVESQVVVTPSAKGIKLYILPTCVDQMDKDFLFSSPKGLECTTEVFIKHKSILAGSTPPTGEVFFAALDADGQSHFLRPEL